MKKSLKIRGLWRSHISQFNKSVKTSFLHLWPKLPQILFLKLHVQIRHSRISAKIHYKTFWISYKLEAQGKHILPCVFIPKRSEINNILFQEKEGYSILCITVALNKSSDWTRLNSFSRIPFQIIEVHKTVSCISFRGQKWVFSYSIAETPCYYRLVPFPD